MSSSSELTNRRQSKTVYSYYIAKKEQLKGGCITSFQLTSGSGAKNSASELINIIEGAIFTTPEEQTNIQRNNSCPVTSSAPPDTPVVPPVVQPPLRLLILNDGTAEPLATTRTTILNRLTALGYTDATVTTTTLTNVYTGSDITTTTYNTVLYYTNNATGAAQLSTNLKNFVNAGGNLVTAVFMWNVAPTGFDYTITPFQASGAQASDSTCNMTVNVVHPITTGVNTSLTGGVSIFTNQNLSLQSGATKIASFTSSGWPLVGINTIGTSRVVGLNIGIYTMSTYINLTNLVVNACLWANKNIS